MVLLTSFRKKPHLSSSKSYFFPNISLPYFSKFFNTVFCSFFVGTFEEISVVPKFSNIFFHFNFFISGRKTMVYIICFSAFAFVRFVTNHALWAPVNKNNITPFLGPTVFLYKIWPLKWFFQCCFWYHIEALELGRSKYFNYWKKYLK